MQFRILAAVCIFMGSYLPLSLILLAQNYDYSATQLSMCWDFGRADCNLPLKNPVFALTIFGFCALCFAITLVALKVVRPKHEVVIQETRHVPTDLMNYTLPYVVSFMSIDYQDMSKFSGLVIFLGWMFWITHKSGQILLNPLLIVFGWRFYDITYQFPGSERIHTSNALVHGRISSGQRQPQVQVQDLLIIKNSTANVDG